MIYSWPSSSSIDRGIDKLTLDSVSINVHGDLLIMIVGAVGSGKVSTNIALLCWPLIMY